MGDKWYLTFSNYSRWWETRYRVADSFDGPWRVPAEDDMFDGREFYAAKLRNGREETLYGWLGIHTGRLP